METGEECAPLESTLFLDFVQRRVCLQVDNCAQVWRKLFPQQESTCSIDASHFASTTWKQLNPHSRCLVEAILHALSEEVGLKWIQADAPADMAAPRDVVAPPGVVFGSVLLLGIGISRVWGSLTTIKPRAEENKSNNTAGPNIAAIVAPTVTLGVLAIVLGVLGWLFFVVKKKRQTEGTYRPSAEEQSGACSVAAPDALKLPKEERLI
uniref:Crumbs homolog 3a n=1 Tax=Oryzias sinensis TaxID=183150 RepID=A0A8C7XDK0_9TELE